MRAERAVGWDSRFPSILGCSSRNPWGSPLFFWLSVQSQCHKHCARGVWVLETCAGCAAVHSCWTSPKPRELTTQALVVARERLLESVSAAGVEGLVEVVTWLISQLPGSPLHSFCFYLASSSHCFGRRSQNTDLWCGSSLCLVQ